MNDETNDSDADAGISHVKRRPWMRVGNVKIEQQKIDHMPVQQSIGQVSQNSSKQKRQRNIAPRVSYALAPEEKHYDKEQRQNGKSDESSVVVSERAKCSPSVSDMNEIEETRNHRRRVLRIDRYQHVALRDLVEQIKGDRKE